MGVFFYTNAVIVYMNTAIWDVFFLTYIEYLFVSSFNFSVAAMRFSLILSSRSVYWQISCSFTFAKSVFMPGYSVCFNHSTYVYRKVGTR